MVMADAGAMVSALRVRMLISLMSLCVFMFGERWVCLFSG